jgi:hypothetical protein
VNDTGPSATASARWPSLYSSSCRLTVESALAEQREKRQERTCTSAVQRDVKHPVGSCAISTGERPYRLDERIAAADRKGSN